MRIVCLITVGAFVLSIAIAESDVPIGVSRYQQRPRPIIFEPMLKMKSNNDDNPINWFMNMFSRVIEPQKKPLPPLIGPINLPGMGGRIYIRQFEKHLMPWESNHVVIKLKSHDSLIGNTLPIDSSAHHHRPEDPSRRAANSYGFQPVNHAQMRQNNNMIQHGFVQSSSQPQFSSWHHQQRPRHQHHVPQHSKPFRPSSPNDFRYDNYGKDIDQDFSNGYNDDHLHRRPYRMNYQRFTPGVAQPMNPLPLPSMYRSVAQQPSNPDPIYSSNEHNDQFKNNQDKERDEDGYYDAPGKLDSLNPTQLPYPEYSGFSNEEFKPIDTTKSDNISYVEHTSAIPFKNSARYKQFVRTDRMVSSTGHRNRHRNFSTGRKSKQLRDWKNRGFREGPTFGTRDVGGIEVITAPNLQRGWEEFNNEKSEENDDFNSGSKASESDFNQNDNFDTEVNLDEDTIDIDNRKNLARGESIEHSNERIESQTEESIVPVLRNAKSRKSSYKIIDRSHRSQGSQRHNNTTDTSDSKEKFSEEKIEDRKSLSVEGESKDQISKENSDEIDTNTKMNNVTAEVVKKVVNLTGNNRRLQGRRTPRIVKAIYRRKPVAGIIKSSAESTESSEEKSSKESSEK